MQKAGYFLTISGSTRVDWKLNGAKNNSSFAHPSLILRSSFADKAFILR
ncbi:MAG TPA: hypothetical protein VN726_22255 [Hanamia sp.]|jgi:hypothetical protein|nr:hypothetical protein [Hanamia sp.]